MKFVSKELNKEYSVREHSSGLKIYIFKMKGFSSYYAVFGTKYGSIDNEVVEVTVPAGIAHFLEHKLFESEEGDAFTRFADTGASANAYTSFDKTCYLFSCSNNFYKNLEILLDFVRNPYFTEATVAKEQGIIGEEIKMYQDIPNFRVFFNLLEALYVNNSVKIDIPGTVESISHITDKLLYDCYNYFYRLSNMFLIVVGDVDEVKVLDYVDKAISDNKETLPTPLTLNEPQTLNKKIVEQYLSVAKPLFAFGYKVDFGAQKSLKEMFAVNILLKIIAGKASPLYKRLIEQNLINEEFTCEYFQGRSYATVFFEGESDNPEKVCGLIKEEIAKLKKGGLDTPLFEAIKKSIWGETVKSFDNPEDIASQLTECAIRNEDLFSQFDVLKNLSLPDTLQYLDIFKDEFSAISIVRSK